MIMSKVRIYKMKIKNNNFIIFFVFALLIQSCNIFQKTPGRDEVKKSAGEIIKALEKENNIEAGKSIFDLKLFKGLGPAFMRNISTGIIILIISIFVVAIIYLISERVSFRVYGKIGKRELEEKLDAELYDPDIPEKFALEKNFSDAVLYIYRASLADIAGFGFSYAKGMTNLMIYKGINKPELGAAFKNIFTIAEKVLFNDYEAIEDEYLFCRNEFDQLRGMKL